MNKFKTNHIILIASALTFFSTILVGFLLYSNILHYVVKHQKELRDGNEMRTFYLNLPITLQFSVYFFNVTNPEEVKAGKYPIVKEVGPYCYDAKKEKVNVEDNSEEDSLTYNPEETYFFNQSRSGELKQDDYITILNPLIVSMINTVSYQQPRFLKILDKALVSIFGDKNDIYITTRVRDILFDGIPVNCNVTDFPATAVCSQLKGQPPIVEVEKNIFQFSLLRQKNGTLPTRVKVLRGIKSGEDIGRVIQINNDTDLKIWNSDSCNKFRGTDGWIFPSFLTEDEGIWSVSPDLCRSLQAKFVEDTKYKGIKVRKYHADVGDITRNPEEICYCTSEDRCLPKGIMDLTKCMQAPIYATMPHFLGVDDVVRSKVQGLKPDMDKHSIILLFDPVTGTPLVGKKRIQFNLQLQPEEKIRIMTTVPNVLHPILWIEEGVELDGFLLKKISNAHLMLQIAAVIKYIVLLGCVGGLGYGGYKTYREWNMSKIIPVTKQPAEDKSEALRKERLNLQTRLSDLDNGKNGYDNPLTTTEGMDKF